MSREQSANLLLGLPLILEPVFPQERGDLRFDDLLVPGLVRLPVLGRLREVAVPYLVAGTQASDIQRDQFIEGGEPGGDIVQHLSFHLPRLEVLAEVAGAEQGLEGDEGEPPPQCEVDHGQRAVRRVHGGDDVEVLRDEELPGGARVVGQAVFGEN
jgi:hypothetical protein